MSGKLFKRGDGLPGWLTSRTVVAILIGVVSVSGAVLTWRASNLGESATDHDRQSILETVQQQQAKSAVEDGLRSEQVAFARYKVLLDQAFRLDSVPGAPDADKVRAAALRDESTTLAALELEGAVFVKFDPATGVPATYDVEGRRADLLRTGDNERASRLDPDRTARRGDTLRRRSQRLVGWLVAFVGCVVLLTVAQVSRRESLRQLLAGLAAAAWIFALIVALGGDLA